MKINYRIIALLLMGTTTTFAQLITIKGKVSDLQSKQSLAGVTVKVGKKSTKTNAAGNFELAAQTTDLMEQGIGFSCVGYLANRLIYQPNHFYKVEMMQNTTQLNEVVIAPGDNIFKKAIKQIPQNYPNKAIMLKGIVRIQSWRNRSQYFKSDAIVKAYVPPYNSSGNIDVMVLHNQLDTLTDKALRPLPHIGFYNVFDFVHDKTLLNKFMSTKKYSYRFGGKQLYNNHKVFVINTSLSDTAKIFSKMEATFYIDTASYAFVAANITYYNIKQMGAILAKPYSNTRVAYEKIGSKWYLAETHSSQKSTYKNEGQNITDDFIRTEIDTVNVQKIAYKDIVQWADNVLRIDRPNNQQEWEMHKEIFKKAEQDDAMASLPQSLLDTIKQNNAISNQNYNNKFSNRLYRYLTNNNVRTSFAFYKFPLLIKSDFFSVPESVNYGINFGMNYRVYKSLFLGLDLNNNFWNKRKINLSTVGFNVSNEFVFNQNARKITISPFAGYQLNTLNYQKEKTSFNAFNYGLNASFELSHKKALFVSYGLNNANGVSNFNGLNIATTGYTLGFGLVY